MIKVIIYLQNSTVSFVTKFEDYKKTYRELFDLFNASTLQIIKTKNRNIIIAPSKIQAIGFEKIKDEEQENEIVEIKQTIEEDIISD